jgi:hypothetical protein
MSDIKLRGKVFGNIVQIRCKDTKNNERELFFSGKKKISSSNSQIACAALGFDLEVGPYCGQVLWVLSKQSFEDIKVGFIEEEEMELRKDFFNKLNDKLKFRLFFPPKFLKLENNE